MPSLNSSGPASGPPDHANNSSTALVLEFVCLFTHDLKRKQKRWQDGRIKYHTFNKRVMVYDDRGNFVGDMHWRRDWDFDEGEEVELERGGAIVQVAECVGHQDQDLSELVDKRVKEKEVRQARIAARPSILRSMAVRTPMPQPRLPPIPQDNCQTRHRPLQQVIGTPSGHYGRAVVPTESPFEQRQRANHSPGREVDPRPLKRRKHETTPPSKQGYARSLFGASLTLSAVPLSSAPLRRPAPPQARPSTETPPHKHQDTDTRSPTSPPECSSRAPRREGIPRSSRPPLPAQPLVHRNASPPPPDPAQQREVGKLVRNEGFRLDRQDDQAPTNSSRYIASNFFGTASASATSAQPKTFATDGSTPILFEGAHQPANLNRNNAQTPPLSETTTRPTAQEAGRIIVLDEDTEDEPVAEVAPPRRERPSAGSKNAVPNVQKKQKPAKTKKPPLSSPPMALEPVLDTTSDSTLGAGVSPHTEKRTELRLKPRPKRGLLMAGGPPRKAKKAKNGKSIAERLTSAPEPLESIAGPPDLDADAKPSVATEQRPSSFPEDENVFAWSPPTPRGNLIEQSLGNLPRRQLGTRLESEAPFGEQESSNAPMDSCAETPILAVQRPLVGLGENRTEDQGPGPCSLVSDNSLRAAKDAREAKSPKLDVATLVERIQVTRHPAEETSSMATSIKQKPMTSIVGQQRADGPCTSMRAVLDMESSDEEFPRVPVGPRIARLPRRNIKSREVIGYIPSSSPVPGLPARGLPGRPVTHLISQSPEMSNSLPFTERDEVCPVDDGTHQPRKCEAGERKSSNPAPSNSPARGHPPPSSRMPELSCPDPLPDAVIDGILPYPAENLPAPESRERRPPQPGSDRRRPASQTTSDIENSGHIASAPSTDAPPSIVTATENTMDAGLAAVSQNGGVGAVQEGKVQSGPAGQLDDRGPMENTTGLPCNVDKIPPVVEYLVQGKNLDASSGNGPTNLPRRIANPATRGRKAALKSHAAGQVPQSILPPSDPILPRPYIPVPSTRPDSARNERPKRKMQFPGFVSAKEGGPWSKEADDLLGIGRPAS